MRLPDSVQARCLIGDDPFPGAWLSLVLEGKDEKAFSLAFGPGGEDGRIFLLRDDILARARFLKQAVGLDYGQLERRWSGRAWLSVAGAEELRHQFHLSFGEPAPPQAAANRIAAARALRLLYENDAERFRVELESEAPEQVKIEAKPPLPSGWLPERLHRQVHELLDRLARHDLAGLIEAGELDERTAASIEEEISAYGATPVVPPDIVLLLSSVSEDGDGAWTIEAPLWTREGGPSDLEIWIHAREQQEGLRLSLRGIALS
jgi:hypothetical protein